MKTSSFGKVIEIQFDCLVKEVIKCDRKSIIGIFLIVRKKKLSFQIYQNKF
ncbi:hypothetical protein [Clostridium beijerinckii]|uniref:hypothetical protein n=1 Tax=Clostridium beijerinckii TaxID=1520 RepID=UPI0012D3383A|nr:hypothetical protein [Clostridium beijerinckii]